MSFVRSEVARELGRWREMIGALLGVAFGLWLAALGGPAMLVIGGAVALAFLALALIAWRRTRFRLEVSAPGVVEVDEGRISYMGPAMGGTVALNDLVEIEVMEVAGSRRCWRIRQGDGQMLLIPLASAGADRLYDHFATLPGADPRRLMFALDGELSRPRTVWRRSGDVPAALPGR